MDTVAVSCLHRQPLALVEVDVIPFHLPVDFVRTRCVFADTGVLVPMLQYIPATHGPAEVRPFQKIVPAPSSPFASVPNTQR